MSEKQNGQSAAKDKFETKSIPGFEGLYSATTDGRIYSDRRGIYLKPSKSKNGYLKVVLSVDDKQYYYRVHRLIAMTFLENDDENKTQVNHKNLNKEFNWLVNLEWVTPEENINHAKFNDAFKYDGHMDGVISRAYKFTNTYNGKSFSIFGFRNLLKTLKCESAMYAIRNNANTGKIIRSGRFKGYMVEIEHIKAQRLTLCQGVGSSDPK
jgi:hypothetical protein